MVYMCTVYTISRVKIKYYNYEKKDNEEYAR